MLDTMASKSWEWRDDGFGSRYDNRKNRGERGRLGDAMDRNVMVVLQGQVTKMNKLLQSMALSQVNAAGSSIQMNKNIPNKEVENRIQEEQGNKASNQETSSNPFPPPPSWSLEEECIPFVNLLKQMPFYVKFLKDILAKKRKINDFEIVAQTQAMSNVFKNGVLEKMNRSWAIIPVNSLCSHRCPSGGVDMHFNDKEIKFNVVNTMKFSADAENYSAIALDGTIVKKKPTISCLELKNSLRKMNEIIY
ncbi:hypothetical protein E6C27_scaffold270G002870 [Cucumis melo var. makuwa]|uniref:Uncharacterized protein n=1 Tax=Cucumis melo var. makuwa TaxID=1194695 RepID=A0A5A7T9Z8_CUCMM|nr:hypothetical protein E6C27_scaffold270G002870 [Cucumis melo var. makuwa]